MIVSGKILTDNGYKDIKEIGRNQIIINSDHHKQTVIKTQSFKTNEIITFSKNKNLILSADSVLRTIYGIFTYDTLPENKEVYFQLYNYKIIKDTVIKKTLEKPVDCYILYIDGEDRYTFCENYKTRAY